MPRWISVSLVVIFAALAVAGPAFAAEAVFPPGLRIGLEPPGNLKPSARFPGFEDADRKVAITIFDLPAKAYTDIAQAAQAQSGLTDIKQENFSFRAGSGTLISARAQLNDVKLRKWILLAAADPDKDLAVLISVEVPDAALSVYSDAVVRRALASVAFRPAPIEEQLGLMPFKLNQLAGFRVVKVLPAGAVIMTEGPSDFIDNQPYVTVSIGTGSPEQPDERAKFARNLLSSTPMRDLSLRSADAMRIGGAPGFEIRAQAKGPDNEILTVVQWVRFGSGGYLRIVGVCRQENWDALFTRFRAVRDGIDRR